MMNTSNIKHRPPMSDSDDDDYEGFVFGDDIIKKPTHNYFMTANPLQELIDIIEEGDLEKFRQSEANWNRKAVIMGNYTILAYACRFGQLEIVDYILSEWKQSANINCHNNTPLVCVCDRESTENSVEIINKLLQHGAIVDGANTHSQTPLMLACIRGHLDIVRTIAPLCRVNAQDTWHCSALFYAVEGNHLEIVKELLAARANPHQMNRKGYSPRQVAEDRGFSDILDLFPSPQQVYVMPSQYMNYNTLRDYVPQIFLRSDCPEYFQDVVKLLRAVECEHLVEMFDAGKVSLAEFLVMDDRNLKELGIGLPVNRKKVLKLLMDFHLNHWSTTKIPKILYKTQESFYEILMISANHLQNLTIASSSVSYVTQNVINQRLGPVSMAEIQAIREQLKAYKSRIKSVTKQVKYLASYGPKQNPLYIDYNEYLAMCKRKKLAKIFRYSTVLIGLTIFVGFKVKKLF